MKVTINQVVEYKGHNVKSGGSVTLTLSANYDEITKSMELLQLINEDIGLKAKMPKEKPVFIGIFRLNGVNFAKDGKSTIKLISVNTAVDTTNMSGMADKSVFQVQYSGEVETDGGPETEGEGNE